MDNKVWLLKGETSTFDINDEEIKSEEFSTVFKNKDTALKILSEYNVKFHEAGNILEKFGTGFFRSISESDMDFELEIGANTYKFSVSEIDFMED